MFEVTLLKHSFSCLKFQIGVDIFIKCNSLILSFFIFNLFFFTLSWPNITPRDVPWISKDRPQLNFRYLRLVGFPAIFLVVAKILFLVYNWWKLCKRLNVKPWHGLFKHYFPFISYKKLLLNFHSIQVNEIAPPEFKLCFLFYRRSSWSKKKFCEHI